mgnify:CR=1 FL=1
MTKGLLGGFISEPEDKSTHPVFDKEYTMIRGDGPLGYTLNGHGFPGTEVVTANKGEKLLVRFMNEGLMIKDPQSRYTPGRRGLAWFKLKKELATLDVVVVAAELGHGKRNHVLSDYTFAVRDEESGQLLPIGKAYSGLTDVEIGELTEHFLRNAISDRGRYLKVKPNVVLDVAFDSIQPSTRHASGPAMRFPRIKAIRRDKTAENFDPLASAQRIAPEPVGYFIPLPVSASPSAAAADVCPCPAAARRCPV